MVLGVIERPILILQRMGEFVGQHDLVDPGGNLLEPFLARLSPNVRGTTRI